MNKNFIITVEQAKWIATNNLYQSTPLFSYIKPVSKDEYEVVLGTKIVAGECLPALTLQELLAIVPDKLIFRFLNDICYNEMKQFSVYNLAKYIIDSKIEGMISIEDNLIKVEN